jgi:hypothetical protein
MKPISTSRNMTGITRIIKCIMPGHEGSQAARVIGDELRKKYSVDVTTSAGAFRIRRNDSGRFDIYSV